MLGAADVELSAGAEWGAARCLAPSLFFTTSPTSTSSSMSSTPSRCKLASTASSLSRCSRTVTPVVPGCTRWNLAAKGTGRGAPDASVDIRRIGGGNSPLELWLRVRRGIGTLLMESFGEVRPLGKSWAVSSGISISSSQTRTFVLRVNSSGPKGTENQCQQALDLATYLRPENMCQLYRRTSKERKTYSVF